MFKRKQTITPPAAAENSEPEMIVHNMPAMNQASRSVSNQSAASSATSSVGLNYDPAPSRRNFKTVGLVIMAAGIIFIGALVYVSYIFIIKPAAQQTPAAVTPAASSSQVVATATPVITMPVVATTTDLATMTPEALNLATSTATSTDLTGLGATSTAQIDSDSDGLNDLEEAVLGTSATSSDTNNNSYSDFIEVLNNHNPLGSGTLSADANLAIYTNKTIGYTVLYPKAWPQQSLNNDATIIFTAPDNSLLQISAQSNTNQADILTWYESINPNVTVSSDQVQSAATWDGLMSQDQQNFYLTDKKHQNVYEISYIPAVTGDIVYPSIFKMMINSLVIK
jgi:hypothetical protein